jgi:hypothetical protein
MRQLIDADALAKLAHWQLLEELPSLTGVPLAESATLTSVRYRAQRALTGQDKLFRTKESAQRALDAINQMAGPIDPGIDALPELQDISGIDAGEAVLLSALQAKPTLRLLTGDKRCLRALASLSLARNYIGRITILEQVLLVALEKHGVKWVRERVCPFKELDKAIATSLGSRCDAALPSVREGLKSYISEIRQLHAPPLLAEV